ncbi:MAG TPA: hypothetical protein VE978_28500 [Chitinophagales bacterium]|nr:hypothetical protein [Chitinophagales bacterium]
MNVTIQLKPGELNLKLLKKIQKMFKNEPLTISVDQMDETEYLLNSPKNKEFLLQAIQDINSGKGIDVDIDKYAQ